MRRSNRIIAILIVCSLDSESQPATHELNSVDTFMVNNPEWLSPQRYKYGHHLHSDSIRIIEAGVVARRTFDWLLYYDFYTTLTAFHILNSPNKPENNLYFYYNVDIKNRITYRSFSWDLYLFNDYGLRHFFDSLTLKTQDQFTCKNNFSYPIYKKKWSFSLMINTQTKLWNTHQYRMNSQGVQERFLYDGFMSPGIIYYSGGISYLTKTNSILSLGLGSSKVTKIRNQGIFETRNESEISGLKKGQHKKSEFGMTLTTTVPLQKLNTHFHWELFGNIYAPLNNWKEIQNYNFVMNNVFHLVLLKYVRLSWRTKVDYNPEQNKKALVENQLSVGFYLSNHL